MKVNEQIESTNQYGLYSSQLVGLQALSDWWNSNELECTLKGYAGTGKTYLLKTFLKHVVNKTYTITAPTHKALSVMEQHLGIKGMTLQALHGLKPNVELADFDINNLKFMSIGRPKMDAYSLIIIDESSMINNDLFILTRERAIEKNIKILYVG
jgi:ATP-dependent exoDNAse (exonuclease V) alpha subunit